MDRHYDDGDIEEIRGLLTDLHILKQAFEEAIRLAPNLTPTLEPWVIRCDQAGVMAQARVQDGRSAALDGMADVLLALNIAAGDDMFAEVRRRRENGGAA